MSIMKSMLPPITISSLSAIYKYNRKVNFLTIGKFLTKGSQIMDFLNSVKDFFETLIGKNEDGNVVAKVINQVAKKGIGLIAAGAFMIFDTIKSTLSNILNTVKTVSNGQISITDKLKFLWNSVIKKGIFVAIDSLFTIFSGKILLKKKFFIIINFLRIFSNNEDFCTENV